MVSPQGFCYHCLEPKNHCICKDKNTGFLRRYVHRMRLRYRHKSDFKEFCEDIGMEHKRKAPITGNFLWLEFLKEEVEPRI